MSSKVEYLEKYSVAPPPSRDYYGIKVLRDEVILFLWKISHGPHRTPSIKVTKFSEFHDDKILQSEIQRVFGNYLLHHVKNIAANKENSILTLPKNVIVRISKYLGLKDIVNLITLSRTSKEVFDNDSIWETSYRKYKNSKVSKEEKKYAMASSWKQLLKEKKLQESLKNHKSLEDKQIISQPIVKRSTCTNLTTNHRNPNSSALSKKLAGDSKKLLTAEPALRLNTQSKISSEKQKLNLKSTTSMSKIADTKKLLPANKVKTDLKVKDSSRSQLTINKNISQKINSLTKPKSSTSIKSTVDLKNRKKPISNSFETKKFDQTLRNQKQIPAKSKITSKTQNKEVKSNKIDESRSAIFDSDLSKDLYIDDLSSLIEESLKTFKSPRSIFNYDFSVLDDQKSAGDSKSIPPKSEIKFLKKELCHPEDFSKSSARSEIQSDDDDEKLDMAHFTQKYLKARAEFMKKMSEVSNLSTSKTPGSNNSPANTKFPKSLNPIPENLKKTRASIFAAKKKGDETVNREKFKLHSTKGIKNLKK